MSSAPTIHTGFWTNHLAASPALGKTLTLTDVSATALISFLAILVTHAGSRSFKIVRYTIHQLRRHEPRDGLARQHDLLLANSETDMGALGFIIEIGWRWRRHLGYRRSLLRSLPLFGVIFFHTAGWLAAGIASSLIASSNPTLVISSRSQICGSWAVSSSSSGRTLQAVQEFQSQTTASLIAAQSYVRLCYGNSTSREDRAECRVLPRRRIDWTEHNNTSCPWAGMCLEGDNSAFTLDTGFQSSGVLGINSAHPMNWRHTLTCAPLITDGYVERRRNSGELGEDVFHYHYGPINTLPENSTHWISSYASSISTGLTLDAQTATSWIGSNILTLAPIPPLNRTDGDVTILFFGSPGVTFYEPVSDPIFSASTKREDFVMPTYDPLPVYRADNPAGVMGCFEQLTFCNPRTGLCSKPTSAMPTANPVEDELYKIAHTKEDEHIGILLRIHLAKTSVYLTAISLGAAALKLNEMIFANSVMGINQREQWKTELSHLFQLGLANAQLDIAQFGKGRRKEDVEIDTTTRGSEIGGEKIGELVNLLPEQYQGLCRMLMWPEPGFTNVSVLGLVVVLLVSVVLTVVSLGDGVVGKLVGRRCWGEREKDWREEQILGGKRAEGRKVGMEDQEMGGGEGRSGEKEDDEGEVVAVKCSEAMETMGDVDKKGGTAVWSEKEPT